MLLKVISRPIAGANNIDMNNIMMLMYVYGYIQWYHTTIITIMFIEMSDKCTCMCSHVCAHTYVLTRIEQSNLSITIDVETDVALAR